MGREGGGGAGLAGSGMVVSLMVTVSARLC